MFCANVNDNAEDLPSNVIEAAQEVIFKLCTSTDISRYLSVSLQMIYEKCNNVFIDGFIGIFWGSGEATEIVHIMVPIFNG